MFFVICDYLCPRFAPFFAVRRFAALRRFGAAFLAVRRFAGFFAALRRFGAAFFAGLRFATFRFFAGILSPPFFGDHRVTRA